MEYIATNCLVIMQTIRMISLTKKEGEDQSLIMYAERIF